MEFRLPQDPVLTWKHHTRPNKQKQWVYDEGTPSISWHDANAYRKHAEFKRYCQAVVAQAGELCYPGKPLRIL